MSGIRVRRRRATHVPPLPIACGDGPWLEDFEGRRYFDATSSWWVNLLGRSPYLASLDADRSLAGAEAALAASDGQIAADQVKLFLVLGGGWGPKANRPSPVSTP